MKVKLTRQQLREYRKILNSNSITEKNEEVLTKPSSRAFSRAILDRVKGDKEMDILRRAREYFEKIEKGELI